MVQKAKNGKKGLISEEDISTVLQRYTATTVLALLQEVALSPDANIDWNTLVQKTSTGISNVREYQMLWRHLAYRHALLEKLEDEAQPLDDDSDLEHDLEAFPTVSGEASMEAAACVKVLIASSLPSENVPNNSTIEAPLTINIPTGRSSSAPLEGSQSACSFQGTNIVIPVSVQKQSVQIMTPTIEGLEAHASTANGSLPPRRKRKPWSEAEDNELIAAVQKCGEGNWANILKSDFKGDRTASQLSQRWAIIRKRHANLNLGGDTNGPQLTEAQLATRRAVSMALNIQLDNMATASSIGGASINTISSNSCPATAPPEASLSGPSASQPQHQSHQGSTPTPPLRIGSLGSSLKPKPNSKKPSPKPTFTPDSMLKAVAVAAGARIATPSDAASLIKAVQSKNAIHINTAADPSIKSSNPGVKNPFASPNLGSHPSNVHYFRTGLAASPLSSFPTIRSSVSRPIESHHVNSVKAKASNGASTSALAAEITLKEEAKTSRDIKDSAFGKQVQKNQASKPGTPLNAQPRDDQNNSPKAEIACNSPVGKSKSSTYVETVENEPTAAINNEVAECRTVKDDKIEGVAGKEVGEKPVSCKEKDEEECVTGGLEKELPKDETRKLLRYQRMSK